MTDIVPSGGKGILDVLNLGQSGAPLPTPFQQEIFLLSTHVAGTTHIEEIESIDGHLEIGTRLKFFREPDNPFDPQAIRIETEQEEKIGYVPQADNVVFSRLMDAGKVLFGRIKEKEWIDHWLRIEIDIYLRD